MKPLFPQLHRLSILADRYRCRSFQIHTSEQLTGMHGWLIHFLYMRQDTPVYQRDIEKTFSIRRSTVTATLNRMEENGLIVRESVPEDARLKRIVLTEKAISLHLSLEHEHARFEQVLTDGISPEELAQFQKTLTIMCQNLEIFESEGGHSTC
ncbi:MAG: MarR family transcriptional regulator [Oscillospiraceae bacterium]|nr:MarR family transcriptional regulator [Oscillospiraceae bacterium]